jgi:hypothetical protein
MFFACHEHYCAIGRGDTAEEAITDLQNQSGFDPGQDDLDCLFVIQGKRKKVIAQLAYRIEGDVE